MLGKYDGQVEKKFVEVKAICIVRVERNLS